MKERSISMAIEFVDRVPTYANRVKVTPEDGTAYYATVERADSPVTNGTPLNAETFNAMQAEIKAAVVTLTVAGWDGDSAPYSQTVTVDGMTDAWVPGVPVIAASSTMETNQAMQTALSCVSQITSAENALTFICYENLPESDVTLRVPGVMV